MEIDSRKELRGEAVEFGPDSIEVAMRERIRETIERLVEEEPRGGVGSRQIRRVGPKRVGYRHGVRSRTVTTSLGRTTFAMPVLADWLIRDENAEKSHGRVLPYAALTYADGPAMRAHARPTRGLASSRDFPTRPLTPPVGPQ